MKTCLCLVCPVDGFRTHNRVTSVSDSVMGSSPLLCRDLVTCYHSSPPLQVAL
jgi:hypothetical protein